jgi:hypothetical protein
VGRTATNSAAEGYTPTGQGLGGSQELGYRMQFSELYLDYPKRDSSGFTRPFNREASALRQKPRRGSPGLNCVGVWLVEHHPPHEHFLLP